jgi:hypothetical protein
MRDVQAADDMVAEAAEGVKGAKKRESAHFSLLTIPAIHAIMGHGMKNLFI